MSIRQRPETLAAGEEVPQPTTLAHRVIIKVHRPDDTKNPGFGVREISQLFVPDAKSAAEARGLCVRSGRLLVLDREDHDPKPSSDEPLFGLSRQRSGASLLTGHRLRLRPGRGPELIGTPSRIEIAVVASLSCHSPNGARGGQQGLLHSITPET
jgi:hypothetical protein